jgi:putative spermidine/putrescine transport system ATP-binding protein
MGAGAETADDERTREARSSKRGSLELRALTKHFGNVVAVEGIDLTVDPGEYVVLLGPSGCGKTTILRMIGGHEKPTSGAIVLDGENLVGISAAKRPTATVFQHFALLPHRSVLGNVEFGLQMRRIGKRERRARAVEMIELVGLREFLHRKPQELSGGQQQRVALARVLVTRPRLLLLDEPFGDLDRLLQLRMRVELRELQRELGITFVHVTHNQEEALSMADRIVVMEAGEIMQVGSPTDITQRPLNVFVAAFMGDTNILHGHVVDHRDGEIIVDVDIGRIASRASDGRVAKVGDRVAVAVRASTIRVGSLDNDPQTVNRLQCQLKVTEYLGDSVKVHLTAGDHELVAKEAEERFADLERLHGQQVAAYLDAAHVRLLDD